jgi:alkaline phosphatase D
MLGEEQWKWLEEQLQVPADIRIIASSIQMLVY